MPIASISLPRLVGTSLQQVGSFTTDSGPEFTTTTTSNLAVNATLVNVVDSSGLTSGAEIVTFPGGGISGADAYRPTTAVNQLGANQFNTPNPGISTAVPTGTTLTRWNRISAQGQPRHVRVTRRDNGDYYDWTEGMEPYSANSSIGGVVALLPTAMLCQLGAVHMAPGVLVAGQTYDIVIGY